MIFFFNKIKKYQGSARVQVGDQAGARAAQGEEAAHQQGGQGDSYIYIYI